MIECTPAELMQMLTTRVEGLRKVVTNTRYARTAPEEHLKCVEAHTEYCALVLEELGKMQY